MDLTSSQEFSKIFTDFISQCDISMSKSNTDLSNENETNKHDIPDLITPDLTPRKESNDVCDNETSQQENDNNETSQQENNTYSKTLNTNQLNFISNSTNTLLTILILNELFILFNGFTRTSFTLFVLDTLMFLFYNSNRDMLVIEQNNFIKNFGKRFKNAKTFVSTKFKELLDNFMDYFFSKNTQMMLKFVYNIMKMKIISTYETYRNKLFNPLLLVQTNKEYVYLVPFYLNGENYKIPIIVSRFNFDNKQPPLMILNKKEQDITKEILQYMGPNYDFYGMALKPKHLNQTNLNFMLEDGSEMNVSENDMMVM